MKSLNWIMVLLFSLGTISLATANELFYVSCTGTESSNFFVSPLMRYTVQASGYVQGTDRTRKPADAISGLPYNYSYLWGTLHFRGSEYGTGRTVVDANYFLQGPVLWRTEDGMTLLKLDGSFEGISAHNKLPNQNYIYADPIYNLPYRYISCSIYDVSRGQYLP